MTFSQRRGGTPQIEYLLNLLTYKEKGIEPVKIKLPIPNLQKLQGAHMLAYPEYKDIFGNIYTVHVVSYSIGTGPMCSISLQWRQ